MDKSNYQEYLGNPLFIKYAIVTSFFIWGKSHNNIADALDVSRQYVGKIIKKWKDDESFEDQRIDNGGHNRKITDDVKDTMAEIITSARSSSIREMAQQIKDTKNSKK